VFSHQGTNDLYHRMFACLQKYQNIKLYFLDSLPGLSGYNGYLWSSNVARSYGFTDMCPVPYDPVDMVNTFAEADAVNRYFESQDITNYHICSPGFHLPRAFQSIISCRPSASVSVVNVSIGDWQETIVHSQGVLKDTVSNMVGHEMDRTLTYMTKGDLVSYACCLRYMDRQSTHVPCPAHESE
jgi:hypothetical protein